MPLTKQFKTTVLLRAQRDNHFRRELLLEAINEFLQGNYDIAKLLLRDYIHVSVSFATLAQHIQKDSKSLQRMLGPNGNPTSESLFKIIQILQEVEGIALKVQVTRKK